MEPPQTGRSELPGECLAGGREDRASNAYQIRSRAKIGVWGGARFPGETGIEAVQGYVAFSVFEVPSVPDFSSSRFPHLTQLDEAQRIRLVGERQNRFLAALQALGPSHAVSLRYYCGPVFEGEPRVRLFLVGRSFGFTEAEAQENRELFRDTVQRNFPSEHYRLAEILSAAESQVLNQVCDLEGVASIVEILKMEQVIPSWHERDRCGFSFFYLLSSFAAADNSMIEFCRSLTSAVSGGAVMADICLLPTSPLTEVERGEAKNWTVICERWGREQRLEVGGGLYSEPTKVEIAADPHAKDAERSYQEVLKRYGSGERLFLYAFRVLSWAQNPPENIASSLVACALTPGAEHRTRTITQADPVFQKAWNAARLCYVTPAVCYDKVWSNPEAPETLRRVHRLLDIDEAAGFFRLPIAGRSGCPGMPLDTGLAQHSASRALTETLSVGSVVDGSRITSEQVGIPIGDLRKSALIVGMPGAGKTTLCYSLLTQLWERPASERIPFIVIEPAKTEYRALLELPSFRDDLWVFSVGKERVSPFRFNPFDVPNGVDVSDHISALKTCFEGAFSLWDPLPQILEEAIGDIYAERGWSEYGVGGEDPNLEPPTMADLYFRALAIAKRTSYKGETAGNIRGALEARLGSLLRGPKGRCLNTRRSIPADMLMSRPIVLELDGLNGEEKALMMMFLLTLVREYAKATRKSGAPLTHVLLVEEAHNVIGRSDASGGGDSRANPKEVAIRFFTDMLAEMRALGEGIIIADQLPTAIAPQAIKNTNIKVMHRLVAADDREELGRAMVLDAGQTEQAAMLPAGQSLVHMEGWARSRLVKEVNFKGERGLEEPPDDSVVTEFMAAVRALDELRDVYLPYAGCKDTCPTCDPRIREGNERRVQRVLQTLVQDLESEPKDKWVSMATEAFLEQLPDRGTGEAADPKGEDRVRGNCSSIHLVEQILRRVKDDAM